MRTTILYLLLSALRDRLFAGMIVALLLLSYIAYYLAGAALVEHWQMAVAYLAGGGRLLLNFGLIVFVCFHIRRGMEHREIDVMLSRPIARHHFIIAYWLALSIAAFLLVLPLVGFVAWMGIVNGGGFFLWSVSLFAECVITVAMTLFMALRLSSVMSAALAATGFYLLGRMMGFFVMTTETALAHSSWLDIISGNILKAIATVLPRLDLFADTQWLIYGKEEWWPLLMVCLAQAIVYVALLLTATMFDLRRRDF